MNKSSVIGTGMENNWFLNAAIFSFLIFTFKFLQGSCLTLSAYFLFTLNQQPMSYWLVKSEPGVYSWDDLVKEKETCWSGIRNYAARLHLKNMKKGDQVFFYHSNEGTAIVGIAKVSKEAYQDPTTDDERWFAVDLKPFKKLKNPVKLEQIKKDKRLAGMALVRIGRLSTQPVTEEEWNIIMEMSEEGQ
jgi:predicted RNA-binding protein with PUA-like domain